MKIKKIWAKAEDYLNSEKKKKRQKRRYLKEVLKRLKHHKNTLKKQIKDEKSADKRKKLHKELNVVQAQRAKGINTLKKL